MNQVDKAAPVRSAKEYYKMKEKRRKERNEEEWNKLTQEEKEMHKLTRIQRQEETRRRLTEAMSSPPPHSLQVCIDLSFEGSHSETERKSMLYQVCLAYGGLRKAEKPVHLHITGLGHIPPNSMEALTSLGALNWEFVTRHDKTAWDEFDRDNVVILSPDADESLPDELDKNLVYVIGGVVDRTVRKAITLDTANREGVRAMRLPIQEHLSGKYQSPVLNVDTVLQCLCTYMHTQDWKIALESSMPKRRLAVKGLKKEKREKRNGCNINEGEEGGGETLEKVALGGGEHRLKVWVKMK